MIKIVDNRDIIKGIIIKDFDCYQQSYQHIFYVVQVILRKKDGCEKDNYPVYQKIIDTPDKIDKVFNDAIYYAEKYNGRVYITASPKIKEKVSLKLAKAFIDYSDNCEKSPESILYSISMMSGNSCKPRIIFDFDGCEYKNHCKIIYDFFEKLLCKHGVESYCIPTVNGFHIISDLIIDYTSDDVIEYMSDEFKQIVKDVYAYNNVSKCSNIHFKTMLKDMLHKESGNILVYYKQN